MSDLETEFERLQRNGDDHYARKEYSIAAECYRAASERGPCDHSLWFKYAFSLASIGKDGEAVRVYGFAITAGSGAAAHNNLGSCYRRLGRNQEARDEFLKATRLNKNDPLYWRNLAACLSDLKDPQAELSARNALAKCQGCTADDWNKLGCARERDGDTEGGLLAFRIAASAEPRECTYFFNVALMNERCGRVLDAYHACRHSLALKNGYESAVKMMPRLEMALKRLPYPPPLPERPREIGPHDYINPYALLNLKAIDNLPKIDEWFDQPEDWDKLLGSLIRRRRALKAELELNDGSLSWLPQLQITDEVVHRVLSELDDSGWHPHHWAIFRLPLLNRFLMHGELEYFYSHKDPPYPLVAEIAGAAPEDFEHKDLVDFISPFFRHRWTQSIKQALDAGNNAEGLALFATNPPVTAVDLDEALEPVRRHFARRQETLKTVEREIAKQKFGKGSVQSHLASSESSFLKRLPRHVGAKLRDDLGYAYRNLSVTLVNDADDLEESDLALKAAEDLAASGPVKERFASDRKTLSGLLHRKAEEKKRVEGLARERKKLEEQLTRRLELRSWLRERTLEITPDHFSWGDQVIAADKIEAVRFGITVRYRNGFKTGTDSILAVRDAQGRVVATTWLDEWDFSKAVQSVMGLYSTAILTHILAALERGCILPIGAVHIERQGISFTTGFFGSKKRLVPWANALVTSASGSVNISSQVDPKAKTTISCREDWNACLLSTLVEILKRSN